MGRQGRKEQTVFHDYVPPENAVPWDNDALNKGMLILLTAGGANVVELEVDPITFEIETKGIWGAYDVGVPIDRRIVEGQIQGRYDSVPWL